MQRILLLLFCFQSFCCLCQVKTQFFVDGAFSQNLSFDDTLQLKNFVEAKKGRWVEEGYLFAGVDSVRRNMATTSVYLHQGERYDVELQGLKKGWSQKHLSKSLANYVNGGYPFASIYLDSMQVKGDVLAGTFNVNPGPRILYDSAFFFAELRTDKRYVYQLLDIVPGDAFSEAVYQGIAERVQRSPFLSLKRPTDISFSQNRAQIFLDLEEQTTNSFQGVLGLQQNPSGGTSVVGSLEFSAQNLFRLGHELDFSWESFAESSQNLDLRYKHAHLLDGKLSPVFRFGLLRQDTTFLTLLTGIGVSTFIGRNLSLLIEFESSNGSLITSDIERLSQQNLADYQRNFYHLVLSQGHLRSLSSFNQGLVWQASVGGGNKEVERNTALPDRFYDSIALKTNFLRAEGMITYQVKVGKRQTIFQQMQVGVLDNRQLLTNELFRVGGLHSLRGFNEKNFFASQFALSRLEFRSFFENSSFIYAFYDQLVVARNKQRDYPFGIGLGFALETSTGQFSFALASGNSKTQDLSFSELRAHFGFITTF